MTEAQMMKRFELAARGLDHATVDLFYAQETLEELAGKGLEPLRLQELRGKVENIMFSVIGLTNEMNKWENSKGYELGEKEDME